MTENLYPFRLFLCDDGKVYEGDEDGNTKLYEQPYVLIEDSEVIGSSEEEL